MKQKIAAVYYYYKEVPISLMLSACFKLIILTIAKTDFSFIKNSGCINDTLKMSHNE